MKKVFAVLAVYTVLVFLCCLGETFIYRSVPELLPKDVSFYRVMRALGWFLMLLPSIFVSGYAVACAVLWKANTNNSKHRFSPAMVGRYRIVVLTSIVLVAILSFNSEIFRPVVEKKMKALELAPVELDVDIRKVDQFLAEGRPDIAYMYAQRAVKESRGSAEMTELLKRTKDKLDVWHSIRSRDIVREIADADALSRPLYAQDHGLTLGELMEKASTAFAENDYLNAHYWSSLAVEACDGTDTNLSKARFMAEEAWNKLKVPDGFADEEKFRVFRRKYEGYVALTQGDYLKAYYVLHSLQTQLSAKDADVERYLALAKEAVENDYFFIDEAENMELLSTGHDVHFALTYPDGSKNVFFVKSVMDSSKGGSDIRYLKDMSIMAYSSSGRFLRSVYVPLAKAVSRNTNVFEESEMKSLGINPKWSQVPYIMLKAIDRSTQGVVTVPIYSDVESGIPQAIAKECSLEKEDNYVVYNSNLQPRYLPKTTTMILPMQYSDFSVIDSASAGPDTMSLFSLLRIIPSAPKYGYAQEVFMQSLLTRTLYPIFVLILFVIAASTGWNYRIEDVKIMFKTSWLFLIILFGAVMYALMDVAVYGFKLINYVLVGVFGMSALPTAVFVYVSVFVVTSLYFMSRKK